MVGYDYSCDDRFSNYILRLTAGGCGYGSYCGYGMGWGFGCGSGSGRALGDHENVSGLGGRL